MSGCVLNVDGLRHRYLIVRHAVSLANERRLIVSSPGEGVKADYGLSAHGKRQAAAAGKRIADWIASPASQVPSDQPIAVCTSPFSRAVETARRIHDYLGQDARLSSRLLTRSDGPVVLDDLRERSFGNFELKGDEHYQTVWANDSRFGERCEANNVESTYSVAMRAAGVIRDLERRFMEPRLCILVSHGDTLQILQAVFSKVPPHHHRRMRHLENCEFRELNGPSVPLSKI
jgi:broad specificity phosphatase PhoE